MLFENTVKTCLRIEPAIESDSQKAEMFVSRISQPFFTSSTR